MKKVFALILAAALLCCLSACGETTPGGTTLPDGQAQYTVHVVDALGQPYTQGVIVRFMENGAQAAMQVVDNTGTAVKVLPEKDYTVEVMLTAADAVCHYDQASAVLSADSTELTIEMAYALSGEPEMLHADGKEHDCYTVDTGCTYVPLTAGERNYFLFAPMEPGAYKVSMAADAGAVGYYGAPHFVQSSSAAEVVDNAFTISVRADMIGTGEVSNAKTVIGVDPAEGAEGGILIIQRIGDPEWSVEDEPWTVYQAQTAPAAWTLPQGAQVRKFDLTASTDTYALVYNEADGFYHLNSADGPLVVMYLTEDPGQYLPCFKYILDHSGLSRYFYDENGKFMKKETYDQCLLQYFPCADEESGLYPLTEDLKYIIQQRGEYVGWWEPDSDGFIFRDDAGKPTPGINYDIAWLFMCGYLEAN